jgi:tRNA A37 threonylcarbamoyladenosine modification protein TsaB
MTVLTLRTDRPEAELGLYDNQKQLAYTKWQAHLELSKTIHKKITELLNKLAPPQNLSGAVGNRIAEHQVFGARLSISLDNLEGIVCYSGPGSFTGLRIGLSVANTLAYAQDIPIVAKTGQGWIEAGIKDLQAGKTDKIALPKYGSPPNITEPRK